MAGPHPVIEPTGAGEWCSPYNVHREKRRNPRVVFNYKGTNLRLKDLKFPIPVIDELLQQVSRGHIFSVLDLKAGYHQLGIDEGSREALAFEWKGQRWRFCRLVSMDCSTRVVE